MRRGHAFPESRRSKSTEDLMTARILLVEDDPTTCAFLAAAARGVPAEVDVAGSCAAALALRSEERSCRERVCQYVEISVVAVSLKKNKKSNLEQQPIHTLSDRSTATSIL